MTDKWSSRISHTSLSIVTIMKILLRLCKRYSGDTVVKVKEYKRETMDILLYLEAIQIGSMEQLLESTVAEAKRFFSYIRQQSKTYTIFQAHKETLFALKK